MDMDSLAPRQRGIERGRLTVIDVSKRFFFGTMLDNFDSILRTSRTDVDATTTQAQSLPTPPSLPANKAV